MDELQISGKRFISSRRAAKEHKYHSDYIGQLIRGGKVVGQKVGRAWYVEANSLATYLGKERAEEVAVATEMVEVPEKVEAQKMVAQEVPVQSAVVEAIYEIETDVHRIPIHSTSSAYAKSLRENKHNTLTYITDDAPHFLAESENSVYTTVPQEERKFVENYPTKKSMYKRWGAVALVGVAALFLVAGASYFLTYNAVVNGGEMSASVSFGFPSK